MTEVEGYRLERCHHYLSRDGRVWFVQGDSGWRVLARSADARSALDVAGIRMDAVFSHLREAVEAADSVTDCGARPRSACVYLVHGEASQPRWKVFRADDWLPLDRSRRSSWRLVPYDLSDLGDVPAWNRLKHARFPTRRAALRALGEEESHVGLGGAT